MTTEVYLSSPTNDRLAVLSDFVSLEYALVKNSPAACRLVLPGPRYDVADFGRDYRLQIERNGVIEGNTQFLIRKREKRLNTRGERLLNITALDAKHLLARRWILYYAGSAGGEKTDNPDDLMKALVRENLGSLAQPGQHVTGVADDLRDVDAPDLSAYFAVEADAGAVTPSTTKGMSRRPLLDVLQEIADDAWQSGTWLGFDVVLNDSGLFEFRTYPNYRGSNRGSTGAPVVFSPERGNLVDISRTWDWTQEITVAIAAGQSQNESRDAQIVQDSRKDESPFNWIEKVYEGRNVSTSAGLLAEARQAVREGRPRDILTARILDTPGTRRGTDWQIGDIVAVEFEGETTDVRIDAGRIRVDQGGLETTDVALRVEE
jgi:ReqiPepy6 Gp37-like protein